MIPDEVPDGLLLVDTDVVSYWAAGSPIGQPFTTLVAGHELAISFATYGESDRHQQFRRLSDDRHGIS